MHLIDTGKNVKGQCMSLDLKYQTSEMTSATSSTNTWEIISEAKSVCMFAVALHRLLSARAGSGQT